MRVPLLLAAIGATLLLACSPATQLATENRALVERWVDEGHNRKNLNVADEVFAANVRGHGPNSEVTGLEELRNLVRMYHQAFPDLRFTIEDILAEQNKVGVRWTATGTHRGELAGIAPSGRTIEFPGITIVHVTDDRIVEFWDSFDETGMLNQLR